MNNKRSLNTLGEYTLYTGLLTLENAAPKRRRSCNPLLWRLVYNEVILEMDKLFREFNLLNEMKELFRSQRIWKARFNIVLDQLVYGHVYENIMDDMDLPSDYDSDSVSAARVLQFLSDDEVTTGYIWN